MGKLAVLELNGEFERQALHIKLKISTEGAASSIGETGTLPANPELAIYLYQWQQAYRNLAMSTRIVPKRVSYGRSTTQLKDAQQLAAKLIAHMERWLAAESFRPIDMVLRTVLDPAESIRVLIQTENVLLRRLPWHCWAFLNDYAQAEIAFAAPKFQPVNPKRQVVKEKVQILAILGHSQGINIQKDRQFLERIPTAEVTFLVEPERQTINDQLWDQPWDILFFAGHSSTQGDQGAIYCNPQTSLSLSDLKYGLKQAIAQGLQLAIFNSCDGLGLVHALETLHFPQLVVMREPVADWVAQAFLKQFLQSFTTGQSLYQSVRAARERLQGLEDHFPCASWLPILCQNPAVIPPSWQILVRQAAQAERHPANGQVIDQLAPGAPAAAASLPMPSQVCPQCGVSDQALSSSFYRRRQQISQRVQSLRWRLGQRAWVSLLVILGVLTLLGGVRHQGWLQPLELRAFDHMMQLRPDEGKDFQLLIVEVNDADIQLQQQNQELLHRRSTSAQTRHQLFDISLSDDSLNRLLEVLAPASVIGLDIYRDFPVKPDQAELATRLQAMPQLITVCKAEDFEDPDIPSIDPPPEVPLTRVGFSDFVADGDGLLRRHLLRMLPPLHRSDSRCKVNLSFSVQIAFKFLHQQGITAEFTEPDEALQLGERVFKGLHAHAGGYQRAPLGGNQILLNYRQTQEIAPRKTLTEVLQNQLNPDYFKDKIVLIGVTASGREDRWPTLYGADGDNQMPGVIAQAHMVSQLINAASEQRPLLQVWTGWQEMIWMGAWASIGTVLAWRWRAQTHMWRWGRAIAIATAGLFGLCFIALIKGTWLPFVPSLLALTLSSSGVLIYRALKRSNRPQVSFRMLVLRR